MGVIVLGYDASPGTPTEEPYAHHQALQELVPLRPSAALVQLADREDARMIVVGGPVLVVPGG